VKYDKPFEKVSKPKLKMKKYLLLIEDERLWERFKSSIKKDINTEIIELIKSKALKGGKKSD